VSPLTWFGILVAIIVVSLRFGLGELVIVRGFHMAPNYLDGDLLILGSPRTPKRGDVVTIGENETAVFRRVVGLPGDTIGSVNGRLTRDGEPIDIGECPPFSRHRDDDRSRERSCLFETSDSGDQYGTLGDELNPGRPWSFRLTSVTLEPGQIFVLPDDRKAAVDKTTTGVIEIKRVEGIISHRIWRPEN